MIDRIDEMKSVEEISKDIGNNLKGVVEKPVQQRHLFKVFDKSQTRDSHIEENKPNRRRLKKTMKNIRIKSASKDEKPRLMKMFEKMKNENMKKDAHNKDIVSRCENKEVYVANDKKYIKCDENNILQDEKCIVIDEKIDDEKDLENRCSDELNATLIHEPNEPIIGNTIGSGMETIVEKLSTNDEKNDSFDEKYDPLYDNSVLFRDCNKDRQIPENFRHAMKDNISTLTNSGIHRKYDEISVIDEKDEKFYMKTDEKTINEKPISQSSPSKSPKIRIKLGQSPVHIVQKNINSSLVRLPNHEKKPKLSEKESKEKKEKKVKTRKKVLSKSPQASISKFFKKRSPSSIKNSAGKRKRNSPESKENEKKKRLGND